MTTTNSPPAAGFEQYTDEVYGWAYRVLGRHHDALDVVQDVFLKWARQCGEQPPQQPRGWLRRVTLNRAIDLRRRNRVDSKPIAQVFDGPSTTKGLAAADETIDQAALRNDIAVALDRLTELQRGVLVAKVYDEMTFAQIAAELSLAVSTVKTHYLRAVQAVRDRLQPRWAEEM